jgi:hypothetical protein
VSEIVETLSPGYGCCPFEHEILKIVRAQFSAGSDVKPGLRRTEIVITHSLPGPTGHLRSDMLKYGALVERRQARETLKRLVNLDQVPLLPP